MLDVFLKRATFLFVTRRNSIDILPRVRHSPTRIVHGVFRRYGVLCGAVAVVVVVGGGGSDERYGFNPSTRIRSKDPAEGVGKLWCTEEELLFE